MFPLLADLLMPRTNLVALLVLILDIVAIVSVVAGRGTFVRKLIWSVVILALPFLGMLLYFLIGRSSVDAEI